MVSPDDPNPVIRAFLTISTNSKSWVDDRIVDEIKKADPSLHYITRDSVNNLLGVQRTAESVDAVSGFIRKSYKIRDENHVSVLRCEYVVYGGVSTAVSEGRDSSCQMSRVSTE